MKLVAVCPTCGNLEPCPTCGVAGDYAVGTPAAEVVHYLGRALWALHKTRLAFMADSQTMACERVEEAIRIVDDVVAAMREMGVH